MSILGYADLDKKISNRKTNLSLLNSELESKNRALKLLNKEISDLENRIIKVEEDIENLEEERNREIDSIINGNDYEVIEEEEYY